jgi:BirA family biotin operon repressor/biotin-[acetyl-CoA-carboxylase] ligase
MIIGVGINLRNAKALEEILDQRELKASSLEQLLPPQQALPDTEVLWLALIDSLSNHFKEFDQQGFSEYQKDWLKWDAFLNERVMISGTGQEPIYGIARGVDQKGALLLEQESKTIAIYAGDISLRLQP